MSGDAAKRGNVQPDPWRSIPVLSKPAGRRGFLKLGAALTGGLALGARPGLAEPQPTSPPADPPWSQSLGPGVVDRPYGRPADFEAPETTHFSVVDAEGNAVANTYTLNGSYGCYVAVEGAGFLLNDEMGAFSRGECPRSQANSRRGTAVRRQRGVPGKDAESRPGLSLRDL